MEIDPNIVSRVRGGDEFMQAKEKSDLFTEVHLHREGYVSVEVPMQQMEGYHEEELASPNPPPR
jgi:hypothetical protein